VNGTLSSTTDWAGVALELRAGSGSAPPPGCTTHAQCSDGQFCNGAEQCVSGSCTAGAAVNCSDGVSCTTDSCNEATDSCDHAATNALCSDGQFCNGAETCHATLGCQAGTAPCPAIECNESSDSCGGAGGVVTFEEVRSGGSVSTASVSTDAALAAGTGHLYLAAVSSKSNSSVSAVSGLGLSWTQIDIQCSGRAATMMSLWMAQGAPAAAGAVTATFPATVSSAAIVVARYSGVDPLDPIGAVVSRNANGVDGLCTGGTDTATYSTTLNAGESSSVAFGAVALRNRTHTPGAGYTERAERASGSGGDTAGIAIQDRSITAVGPLAVAGTLSSATDYAVVAVEILP
jgi:hypothetical protein